MCNGLRHSLDSVHQGWEQAGDFCDSNRGCRNQSGINELRCPLAQPLPEGDGHAIHAYERHGMVHVAETREDARTNLIERWDRGRQASPDASRIILTHTNDEVRALNKAAREKMRGAGNLGDEVRVTVERGARNFASGDRIMFLQNERGLGVKNGTLGTIEHVSAQSMSVRTDDGRDVAFDLKDYNKIDHGYAATIHKAQGMTVDRTHVLATPGMDAHGSYVALSRHRDGMNLHYGSDDFANQDQLACTLSRDRSKDMATDAEAAYVKNPELVREAAGGKLGRAIRALQLETEIRTGRDAGRGADPGQRADRFVERWKKLDQTRQRQYEAGDMSGVKATKRAMGDMANSLQRDPQLESMLAIRKKELGIGDDIDSGRSLGRALAFSHGLDLGRGRGIGL